MIGKLEEMRKRTEKVKLARAESPEMSKEALIQRLAMLLKGPSKHGGKGASAESTRRKGEDKKKKASITKEAIAIAAGSRPGQQGAQMGAGMVPYQFQAQPNVAAESQEIAGRNLKDAWPGLTAASKSTSAMKRNAGGIKASIKRQTPVAPKGELLNKANSLLAKGPAQLIDQGGAMKTASLSEMEKVAVIGLLTRGARFGSRLIGGGARGGRSFIAPSARAADAAADAVRAAGGSADDIAALARTGRMPDVAARTSTLVDAAGKPIITAGRRGERVSGLRQMATGATTRALKEAPATAGSIGRGINYLKQQPGRLMSAAFGRGTGFRNVYKNKDGVQFLGSRADALGDMLPLVGRLNTARKAKDGVTLVAKGTNTGGWVQRGLKGATKGATKGGLMGYGASYIPGIGDPSTENTGAFSKDRLRMAGGGALLGAGLLGGNIPAAAMAFGVERTPFGRSVLDNAMIARHDIRERGRPHSGGVSAAQAIMGTRGERQRAANSALRNAVRRGNAQAEENWKSIEESRRTQRRLAQQNQTGLRGTSR